MKIEQFKEGDIITRIAKAKCSHGDDGSYLGDRMEFGGFEKGIIFVKIDRLELVTIAEPAFQDDNWDYYPEKLYQKLVHKWNAFKELEIKEPSKFIGNKF